MQIDSPSQIGIPDNIGSNGAPRVGVAVHYVGGTAVPRGDHAQCRRQVVSWHNYHRSLSWAGIGYHYLVCHHGIVMTGRGLNKIGSHAPGGNATHIGVCFMLGGNQEPTEAQLKGFRDLRSWLGSRGVGSNVRPHSSFISTSCPGNHLRGRIAQNNWGTGGTVTPVPGGGGGGSAGSNGGMTSVRSILSQQKAVNEMGYTPKLVEDGLWGPKTNAGVRWAQGKLKVSVDGLWGNGTEAAYKSRNSSGGGGNSGGSPVSGRKFPLLTVDGIRGTQTNKALQTYLGVKVDGIVGRETIRALQRKVGSSADGIWGANTTRALQRALNNGSF